MASPLDAASSFAASYFHNGTEESTTLVMVHPQHQSHPKMTPSTQIVHSIPDEDMPGSSRLVVADDEHSERDVYVEKRSVGLVPELTPQHAPAAATALATNNNVQIANNNVVVKPVAVKVLRPIPKRMSEQFYNQAYAMG